MVGNITARLIILIASNRHDYVHLGSWTSSSNSCLSAVALNANRHVSGVLRGFDQFMNIVLDNAVDEKNKTDIGMVVRSRAAYCW